jgi:probable phosphoglycerate mutase
MVKVRLTCIRHGETHHNRNGVVQGWIGADLTDLGHQQAHEFADRIINEPDVIFYSDLSRCQQTAAPIIAKFPKALAVADWRLRERSYGSIEGKSTKDVDWESFQSATLHESPLGAEPVGHVQERIKSFLRDTALLNVSNAIVITHGGVLNQLSFLFDPENTDIQYSQYGNAESLDIEYSLDDPRLRPSPIPKWSAHV